MFYFVSKTGPPQRCFEHVLFPFRLNYDRDLVVNLKHEHEKMVDVCEQEEKQIDRLKKVLSLVEQCEKRMAPGCDHPLSLEDCATVFKTLHDDYYEEYKIYDLGTMALALVFPLVRRLIQQLVSFDSSQEQFFVPFYTKCTVCLLYCR